MDGDGAHSLNKPRSRVLLFLVVLGLWTIFPVLQALQAAFYSAYIGNPVEWQRLLPIRLADWYTCALFTPVGFWLVRRFPFRRGVLLRNVAIQLGVTSIVVALKYAIYAQIGQRLLPARTWRLDLILAEQFVEESLAIWALLGIVHAIEYYRRQTRLEAELASARLDALTAQLHPHFLFNTLNSITTLMRRDVDAAEEMLVHLSELLHRTLQQRDRHEIPLAEELELLRHYVEIMQIRFQDRLSVEVDVDEGVQSARVPPFILQPLVENAIRHGIARKPGAGRIEISARAADDTLELSVRDDGEGFAGAEEGVGLSNTRRRLRELYGDAHSLELTPALEGGLLATVRIPCAR